jgi:hypothetical protein
MVPVPISGQQLCRLGFEKMEDFPDTALEAVRVFFNSRKTA